MKKYLTRNEYCLGIRCPGLLWILKNRPEGLSPYSERNIILLHNKKAADLYTESLSGIRFIPETSVEEDAKATDEAIKEGVLDIAGATFVSGSLSCRCDLIKRRSDGTYALYIIRAAAHIRQTEPGLVYLDGYYYYLKPVSTGASTDILFDEVAFASSMGNEYQNCKTEIIISAQAVQTANNGATVAEADG